MIYISSLYIDTLGSGICVWVELLELKICVDGGNQQKNQSNIS